LRGRRADRTNKRKDAVLVYELLDRADGLLRLVAVIDRLQLEPAAARPSGPVRLCESRQNTFAHATAESLGGALESGNLPEDDPVLQYAIFRKHRRVRDQAHGDEQYDESCREARHRHTPRVLPLALLDARDGCQSGDTAQIVDAGC